MKLFIAGHQGLVGSALVRRFAREPGVALVLRGRGELDLSSQAAVDAFYAAERPDAAIIAAGRVGGINANNTRPAEFLYENLAIAANTIHGAYRAGVGRLLFLGSSCIYPAHAPQPMPEESLLAGPLEPTNEGYAVAKIAGLKLCQTYRRQYGVVYHSVMPTNLYGPCDNYDLQGSHVLPALIRKYSEAVREGKPEVVAWGTGAPRREFLHVDDMADACAFVLKLANPPDWVNVGTGADVSIRELTELIAEVAGFRGRVAWDSSKPDGMARKLLDVRRLTALGWKARIGLPEGLRATYASFLAEKAAGTLRTESGKRRV
jgi:GDP-L-fucose synthase